MSDDVATLEAIVVTTARRIDAIRMTQERHEREIREREIGRLATEAELRALRAQINPHFLFNALTTIGHLIQTTPPRALHTLLQADLAASRGAALGRRVHHSWTRARRHRGVPRHRTGAVRAEAARVDQRARPTPTHQAAALVLQPLVENAVKHGVAQREAGRRGDDSRLGSTQDRAALDGSRCPFETPAPARRPTRFNGGAQRVWVFVTSSAVCMVSTGPPPPSPSRATSVQAPALTSAFQSRRPTDEVSTQVAV